MSKSIWRGLIFVLVIIWIGGIAHFAHYKSSNKDGHISIEDTLDQLNLHNSTVQQTDIEHTRTEPVQTTTFATTTVTITTDITRPIENMFLVDYNPLVDTIESSWPGVMNGLDFSIETIIAACHGGVSFDYLLGIIKRHSPCLDNIQVFSNIGMDA